MRRNPQISSKIILSSKFQQLDRTVQILYVALLASADELGFVKNPDKVIEACKASQQDLEVLAAKSFVFWREDNVVIIQSWFVHNNEHFSAPKMDDEELVNRFHGLGMTDDGYTKRKGFKDHKLDNHESDFEKLWKAYPKRKGSSKTEARKSFSKVREDVEVLIKAIEIEKKSLQWQRETYIPHLSTWLNQRRWETVIGEDKNGGNSATDSTASSGWNISYDNR